MTENSISRRLARLQALVLLRRQRTIDKSSAPDTPAAPKPRLKNELRNGDIVRLTDDYRAANRWHLPTPDGIVEFVHERNGVAVRWGEGFSSLSYYSPSALVRIEKLPA
jgi:hypothetical protein